MNNHDSIPHILLPSSMFSSSNGDVTISGGLTMLRARGLNHSRNNLESEDKARKSKEELQSSTSDVSGFVEKMKEMKISRASKQYVYDDEGTQYLDCFIGVAHVGHCHPQVVAAGSSQMAKVSTSQGFKSDLMYKYVERLSKTLPEILDTVFLCNSGSEANDLAIRLARQYTDNEDIVTVEDSFHGNLGVLVDISPKMYQYIPNYRPKDWVHIAPLPSSYRKSKLLPNQVEEPHYPTDVKNDVLQEMVAKMCTDQVERIFQEAEMKGRRIAAFICEPCMIVNGIYFPHPKYFEKVCQIVRNHGALVIFDETQTGLGRTGDHFWGFQNFGNVIPDIVTVGRPLGAGHPIGAVVTSNKVSKKLGAYYSTFGGNPVSCAIGLAVLDVIQNENLLSSVRHIGKVLHDQLDDLKVKYSQLIGDVRGRGLVHGLEIVTDNVSRKPNSPMAINIMYGLKAEKILVGICGKNRNVVFISPPMCFTMDNCRRLMSALDKVLSKYSTPLENDDSNMNAEGEASQPPASTEEFLHARHCIAGPVLAANRSRKKRMRKMDHNAHLFAVDKVPPNNYSDEDSDDSDSEQEQFDSKKAKMELDEYADVD